MTISSPRRKTKAQRRVVDHANSRRSVASWVMWDVGSSSFDSIMTTFIFTVYLTSSYFGTPEETSSALSLGLTIAGFLIAILAPVTGQRNDKSGKGIFWLGVNTMLLVGSMAACFFVGPTPQYLWLGVTLRVLCRWLSWWSVAVACGAWCTRRLRILCRWFRIC